MKKYKNALISVFDKNKLDQIAHYLIKKNIQFIQPVVRHNI